MDKKRILDKLKLRLTDIEHLGAALALLDWDMSVNMPPKASETRAKIVATLSSLAHTQFTDPEIGKLLFSLKRFEKQGMLDAKESAIYREVNRSYVKELKLPDAFVNELARTTSEAHGIWVQARKSSNFKLFSPQLSKIVELKRRQADYLGWKESPYDALLEDFEPGLTSEEVSSKFHHLKEFLTDYVKKISNSKVRISTSKLKGVFDVATEKEFNRFVASKVGFDFEAGRMDESAHPFSTSFGPGDARITTRYKEDDVLYSLGSTIHEVGHALYEQGLKSEYHGTPLGTSVSLGIHESQSRLWENLVGKSFPFWKYFYPNLQKFFTKPFNNLQLEEFYNIINLVKPSLIRTEADEVTYNLHIVIRFEIEKELIDGSIEVKDLPKIWNSKYKEYLGVKIPDDATGVLQDVHWSAGLFGYFPTYTLGNLYSAQFYNKAKQDMPNLEKLFSKGKFQPFLSWLRTNIHEHGKLFTAAELCQRVTGEGLNPEHYMRYITGKYNKIYKI